MLESRNVVCPIQRFKFAVKLMQMSPKCASWCAGAPQHLYGVPGDAQSSLSYQLSWMLHLSLHEILQALSFTILDCTYEILHYPRWQH